MLLHDSEGGLEELDSSGEHLKLSHPLSAEMSLIVVVYA